MPTITKLFSAEEAAQHNAREDFWIVVDGKTAGKDATDGFEDAGHSKEARELLETFCIDELNTWAPSIHEIFSNDQRTYYCKKLVDLPKQYWVVPVVIVGISVVIGFLYCTRTEIIHHEYISLPNGI